MDLVKFFLKNTNQITKEEDLNISRLYFASLCRTFDDFIKKYKLDKTAMKQVIKYILIPQHKEQSHIINFGISNKVLASRLKKILCYRLEEAQVFAIDFQSKIDFYFNLTEIKFDDDIEENE